MFAPSSSPSPKALVEKMKSEGATREEILTLLTRLAESVSGADSTASILVIDENGTLRNGASPKLPADYLAAIDRIKPDKSVGTCASTAATGEITYTPDFFADEKWAELRHLPMSLGYVGAWSFPIKTAKGKIVGTFGTYFRNRRFPTQLEQENVRRLAEAAALAIED